MNLLALNDDVLTNIVFFLGCRDALSLSATARHIHPIAKRRVHTAVELHFPMQTPRFSAHMLADVHNRAQRLQCLMVTSKALSVDGGAFSADSSSADALADLLEQTTNLRALSLGCASALMKLDERIWPAIANLLTLEDLTLDDMTTDSTRLLPSLKGQPSRLRMRFAHYPSVVPDIKPLHSVLDLELEGITMLHDPVKPTWPVWPNVRRLGMDNTSVTMSTLLHTFPNVRKFVLGRASITEPHWKLLENKDGQMTCWPDLDYVYGLPYYFGDFGTGDWPVCCPVQWLNLIAASWEKPQHRPALLRAMKVLPPAALSFRFQDVGTTSYSFFVDLVQTATRMRSLEIVLVISANVGASDFQWLEGLMLSRVVCLKISLDRSSWKCTQTIDPEKLVRTIPSVQYLSLPHFGDADRLGEHRWWRAVGRAMERTTQPIPNRIGDRVLDYIRSPQYDPITNLDDLAQ
ncbi:uncharacterized protein B0H18DRAFT_142853 [Fomitopsis serialis]|uniref:uncharacterized protein n=1 Tax=Fomitopsis serialis TaxID=139415 RepID=UPI002008B460|nr:uncharacterized protein B0H18DRAFT_142853 [Neoantrodia serialis]KAH9930210.1 hypothetical protein B0H18DRAFT_142853 [Neoantrodia serialis]